VSPLVVVALATDSASRRADQIARLEPPPLDEGPHLGYAFQWFAFATIALAGSGVVIAKHRAAVRHDPRVIPLRRY
jgi:cytochrome oxidase assembly protein ShyY1